MNLREKNGFTYGAFSGFAFYREGGPFFTGAQVRTDVTGPAARELFSELNRIHTDPATPEELKLAKVSWANEDQLRFVLREGRKRQIRRMCEAVGLVVTGLKRVRIGSVVLGKLPPGQWRYLREDERF